ncbi:putative transcription factor bHLH family [Rosa chinensis]|uniref:Putative transcription factor bHLH family n=1 Tax=Rosa chinensis TaxID=74649 RepID=A0A2P6P6Z3_ROSCH|nr:transcription factor EGL1 [Rosa chinensis]PRQ17672.1 putative transcription factor bHLH family [Rosa chinensis]
MGTRLQNQERVPENLRKQLAIAVRSIQWSYAIFWSISPRQPGVLEWGDGYYNGDIKTRKTVQAIELDADQMGLQRSEHLRELYESLSAGEASPQARRPSAALSPEDLADTEWYYLVCMSFVFNIGQGLPGRTLANGQPIWLCNAHYADSKVFSRSLLAKSASIQTVVCFPFMGGVIELGVTELVLEDPGLIQHVKTSFLEVPYPLCLNTTNPSAGSYRNDNDLTSSALDQDVIDTKFIPIVRCEEIDVTYSSNGFGPNQPAEDSFMVEGMNGAASQVQSWQYMDDELSNYVHHSMDSSDCISQTLVYPEKIVSGPKGEKVVSDHFLQDHKECNSTKQVSLAPESNDLHYQSVLSSLLKSSHQLILGPHFQNGRQESSFVSWKKGGSVKCRKQRVGSPQYLLKKILFEVPKMHVICVLESPEDNGDRNGVWRPEAGESLMNHVLSERKRREKLNERFSILKSLVPSIQKDDKVAILDEAIEYLKDLEKRVEELETSQESTDLEATIKRKPQDNSEKTSDSCCNDKRSNGKKPLVYKRKACDIDETEPEINYVASKNSSSDNVKVSMNNKGALIEMRFPWREGVLLEIMDVTSSLHLDTHSVESSTTDGILFLTIQSRFKGSSIASAGTIEQALQRIARNC